MIERGILNTMKWGQEVAQVASKAIPALIAVVCLGWGLLSPTLGVAEETALIEGAKNSPIEGQGRPTRSPATESAGDKPGDKPIDVRGQVRNWSNIAGGRGSRDTINFVRTRVDYQEEIVGSGF